MSEMIYFTVLLLSSLSWAQVDWCDPSLCTHRPGTKHTMCVYSKPGFDESCPVKENMPYSTEEKVKILELHNMFRNNYSLGMVRSDLPTASNMRCLSWDTELETVAKRWAYQCKFAHDDCRNVKRFLVGQNIAQVVKSDRSADTFTRNFVGWFQEVDLINKENEQVLLSYRKANEQIGHFTQAIWANTTLIGCGRVPYQKMSAKGIMMYGQHVVCNYGASGNVYGYPVYVAGPPVSKCPDGTGPTPMFPGLCSAEGEFCTGIGLGLGTYGSKPQHPFVVTALAICQVIINSPVGLRQRYQ